MVPASFDAVATGDDSRPTIETVWKSTAYDMTHPSSPNRPHRRQPEVIFLAPADEDPRVRLMSGTADFGQGGLHRVGEPLDDLIEVVRRGVVRRGDDDRVATRPVDIAAHRVTDQSVVE